MKPARCHFPPVVASLAVLLLSGLAAPAQPAAAPTPVPDTLDLPTAIGFALEHNFAIRQARAHQAPGGRFDQVKACSSPNAALNELQRSSIAGLRPYRCRNR